MLIELKDVTKIYNQGRTNQVMALEGISLEVAAGEMVCLQGASGSGKSTLLAVLGCVLTPTSGRAAIGGVQISRMPDRFLTLHRRKTVGFIFQQFNVLPELTVLDNVVLPLLPLGVAPKIQEQKGDALLERLGIAHRRNFAATEISGGELQRVAIARALVMDPPIILADEPTAHLDTARSRELMDVLRDLKNEGRTVVIASHDPLVTEHPAVDRVVRISDGRIDAG